MTNSPPGWQQPDLMGGPDVPFDTMEGGREPAGENPDIMAVPWQRFDMRDAR